jgi:hypothetical protein
MLCPRGGSSLVRVCSYLLRLCCRLSGGSLFCAFMIPTLLQISMIGRGAPEAIASLATAIEQPLP